MRTPAPTLSGARMALHVVFVLSLCLGTYVWLAGPDVGHAEVLGPDPALTPGDVSRDISAATLDATICAARTSSVRIPVAQRDDVYRRYGIAGDDRSDYVVDTLVPPELAGTVRVTNLWPRPRHGSLDAATARFERGLRARVCAHTLDVGSAQHVVVQALTSRRRLHGHRHGRTVAPTTTAPTATSTPALTPDPTTTAVPATTAPTTTRPTTTTTGVSPTTTAATSTTTAATSTTAPTSTTPAPTTTAGPTTTGPTTTAPGTRRDVTQWPFATTSPWNMPLGDGARFDARQPIDLANTNPWIAYDQYSIPVFRASASDPLVTITAVGGSNPGPATVRIPSTARSAAGGDQHMVVISPDGSSSDEWWALDLATGTAGAYIHVDLRGAGVGIGWARATGVSLLGGLVRAREVADASIPHALALALPGNVLGQGYVWPAVTADAAGPGFVPEGSLLAIPPGTPEPAGLSPLGAAMFQALTRYGAYVVDQTGGGAASLVVEPSADASAVLPAYGDVRVLLPMLRLVTDNGPGTVGGPGNRVAAMAPGV